VADAVSANTPPADVLVALVVSTFAGEVGRASGELYVAIRHDDERRQHMLRIQHDLTQDVLAIAARLIEPRTSPDRLASTFWMTVNLVRGTVVDAMHGRNPQHRKEILARWTDLAGVVLTGP
jgi:hypothetical protein